VKKILFILFALALLLNAREVSKKDLQLHIGNDIRFGTIDAKIVYFGGYQTPECRLAISNDGQYFYLKKVNSTCRTMSNSKGVKIICNSDTSVCKTRKELIAFLQNSFSEQTNQDNSDSPSWCDSSHLNKTEHTICANEELSRLDKKLVKVYGSAKASTKSQREWLAQRNRCKNDIECIKDSYKSRINELANQNNTSTETEVVSNQTTGKIYSEEDKRRIIYNLKFSYRRSDIYYSELQNLDSQLKRDKDFMLNLIKKIRDANILKIADDSLKKNREFVLKSIRHIRYGFPRRKKSNLLKYVDANLKNDWKFLLGLLNLHDNSINRWISKKLNEKNSSLNKNNNFITEACKIFPEILQYADSSLKKDREVVLAAVKSNGYVLKYADDSLKKDKEVVLAAVKSNGYVLKYADNSLKKNKEVVLAAVKENGGVLNYADDSFKKDKKIVLAAVKNDFTAIAYADNSLKKDKEIALAAVTYDGRALEYVDGSFKNNIDFILEAVKSHAGSLEYVDESLKKDRNFALNAVKNNGMALEYLNDSFRNDKEIVLAAVKNNGVALEYATHTLKQDKEIVSAAVNTTPRSIVYADCSLLKDKDLRLIAKQYKNWRFGLRMGGHAAEYCSE